MMHTRIQLAAGVAAVSIAGVLGTTALAGGGTEIRERLTGFQEVPVVSTGAEGKFRAEVRRDKIEYRLRWEDLEGTVTQAHIHLGQRDVNGGISVWLCGNPSATVNPPAGTQACPLTNPASIEGTVTAAQVVGPTGQGIGPQEFDELLRAIRAGVTYANVHSTTFAGGEIRAQLKDDRDDD
jgi:CHRD domain-containing protein